MVWVPEAYSFDAPSAMGYIAAQTQHVTIASGILPIYSRTPTLLAMTAAGIDYLSDGRCMLGLGASGPQVIEGFHGVPYDAPTARIREIIEICRMVWRREKVSYDGRHYQIPLPQNRGTGLGKPLKLINHPVREDIPIFWASLMGQSVKNTAKHADGWLPIFFDPEKFHNVWGDDLKAGTAERDPDLGPLQISAGGMLAIGDEFTGDAQKRILDLARPNAALYIGGMGARDKNFYNTICQKYGYVDEAIEIQDLYLSGKKEEAAAAVPDEMMEKTHLVGPEGYVRERIAAYKEAGVTHLSVSPVGSDPIKTIETLRTLID
jgi:F420-dependent oxidoreductase-like protein